MVLSVTASSSCGAPASQSANNRPPQLTTFVFATFFRVTVKAFRSGPPVGCVPKVFRYRISFASVSSTYGVVST